MNLDDAADIFTIVGAVAAVVLALSVVAAFMQYTRGLKVQRAQWLVDLFGRFYERGAYQEVRGLIEGSEKGQLLSAANDDPDLEQKLTDYLNFFELVAYLEGIGELKRQDVDAMFKYWIDNLGTLQPYLKKYDYENLVQLLGRRGLSEERK